MDENNDNVPKIEYLDEKSIKQFEEEIAFEQSFYSIVAGTPDFEVIPIPCIDGSYLSVDEKRAIATFAKTYNKKLLFRVSLGAIALTFCEDSELIGISPEYSIHGFPC